MSEKKFAVLIGDGMADFPIEELGGRTPLQAAQTPNMDYIARRGLFGLVNTVPTGMSPGSDIANLSVFGYDPVVNYTGRAPLEALSMDINLGLEDVAFRCNLVTIDKDQLMEDFSAGHIESDFAALVIEIINERLGTPEYEFYRGVSYRHIMVWRNYPHKAITETVPPHDIHGKKVFEHYPKGPGKDVLLELILRSQQVISDNKDIKLCKSKYKGTPTSIWLWGGGYRTSLNTLNERFGLYGHTISAVDLIHGIGRAAGLSPIHVEGATGYIDTNYTGKADALIKAMKDVNFVFLHVESPDESGHEGNLENKIRAIEDFDEKVVGRVLKSMSEHEDFTILVMPDHPTPLSPRTHTSDPVPFCIFGTKTFNRESIAGIKGFDENSARASEVVIEKGHWLIEVMMSGHIDVGVNT